MSGKITFGELGRNLRAELTPKYGAGEAAAMTRLIFHHLKGWNTADMIVNEGKEVSPYISEKVTDILHRLNRNEPLQYILGEARFYGMDLKVAPGVLIPRPETAELVDIIVKENDRPDLMVLDVGTGSGAIAIALSRNLPFSRVTALDISDAALIVARENAKNLHARINFVEQDIFTWNAPSEEFDILVSNPPYIAEHERDDMEMNVLDYEPSLALFVPDDNPLVYYSRIAEVAKKALKHGGHLYFEINPLFATQLKVMLESEGFENVVITPDSSGRNRFAQCVRK